MLDLQVYGVNLDSPIVKLEKEMNSLYGYRRRFNRVHGKIHVLKLALTALSDRCTYVQKIPAKNEMNVSVIQFAGSDFVLEAENVAKLVRQYVRNTRKIFKLIKESPTCGKFQKALDRIEKETKLLKKTEWSTLVESLESKFGDAPLELEDAGSMLQNCLDVIEIIRKEQQNIKNAAFKPVLEMFRQVIVKLPYDEGSEVEDVVNQIEDSLSNNKHISEIRFYITMFTAFCGKKGLFNPDFLSALMTIQVPEQYAKVYIQELKNALGCNHKLLGNFGFDFEGKEMSAQFSKCLKSVLR